MSFCQNTLSFSKNLWVFWKNHGLLPKNLWVMGENSKFWVQKSLKMDILLLHKDIECNVGSNIFGKLSFSKIFLSFLGVFCLSLHFAWVFFAWVFFPNAKRQAWHMEVFSTRELDLSDLSFDFAWVFFAWVFFSKCETTSLSYALNWRVFP